MYEDYRLENGLRVLLVPVSGFQSVSVAIFVGIGSRYESQEQSGMSHFIEHLLFKGTRQRPTAKIIAETIEGVGGVSNAYTGQEITVYFAKVGASQVSTALSLLTDLVRHPLFEMHEFEKERMVIGEEINMVRDIPDSWVNVVLDEVMWPNHPLGQSITGTHQSLAGIDRSALVDFFQKSYHPKNVLIAVGGAFNSKEIMAELNELMGDWPPAPAPTFKAAPPPQTDARCYIEDRAIEQGHFCLALPGLSRNHPDRYALSVLNTILGDGMSSRLFLNIREEKGLAYAVDSGLNYLQDTGSLVIYAGVDPKRAPKALQAILDELEEIRTRPVPPQELRKAKEYIKGRLVLGLEDSFSRTAWVAYQSLFMDAVKTPSEVMAAYDAVTAKDVQAMAQKIIRPSRYNLAAVGPFGQGTELVQLINI